MDSLRELAQASTESPILSVVCRTDPRDPANRNQHPAWLIELRNGLRALESRLEREGPREERLAVREMASELPGRLMELSGETRGRSFALFRTPDGSLNQLETLNIPVRDDAVEWHERPFISPLVDVLDRGRNTGLILVSGERVRLMHWEQGMLDEPDDSVYELELGDWRRYEAYAMANPARGQQTATNERAYEHRVEEWRERFFEEAATATARRLPELGWERVLVVAERSVAERFDGELPDDVRRRLVGRVELNLVDHQPAEIGEQIEPHIDRIWHEEVTSLADEAAERARAGGPATLGADETLAALAEARVAHLIIDPLSMNGTPDELGAEAREVADGATGRLLAERAIEAGIMSGARVTSLPVEDAPSLGQAGGVAAILRY